MQPTVNLSYLGFRYGKGRYHTQKAAVEEHEKESRESCPDDRRGSYAVLTEAESQARVAAWPVISRRIVELFASHVSDEEADLIAQVWGCGYCESKL